MANRTLINFIDLIKVERPEIRANNNFPKSVLIRLINDAQKYVQVQLAHLGIKQWEATDSLTLSSGTLASQNVKTANLNTDCPSRLFDDKSSIKYIETTGATYNGIAKYIDDDALIEKLRNSYTAPTELEPVFSRKNNLLYIAPSTITAGTAVYYKAVTDLASDSDTTTIPENYEEFIVKRVLIEIDGMLEKLNNKIEAINQLTKDIKDIFVSSSFIKVEEPTEVKLR